LSIRNFLRFYFSSERDLRKAIKNIFGFYPGNIFLYRLALRHKSASIKQKDGIKINNERLEYLGDAVLSAVVADYLFKHFPYKDEGFLTEMRSKIVSRASLNRLSFKLGIKNYMLISASDKHQMKSVGGDAFEAFIAALYLDRGYNFTSKIIVKRILKMHFDLDALEESEISYKSKLIEWAQKEKNQLDFSIINQQTIKGHNQYKVEVIINQKGTSSAFDSSIKGAENLAAEKAWKLISES